MLPRRISFREGITVLLLVSATCSHAGPPFVTDDPVPPENKSWEINYAFTGTHAADGDTWALPSADINYGLNGNIQLHILTQAVYASASGLHAFGIGDTEVGVKYRLTDAKGDTQAWAVGLYPILSVPTGNQNRGLGSGTSHFYLPLWVQTQRGAWTFFGGGGYTINQKRDVRNTWSGGGAALNQIGQNLQLGGELYFKTGVAIGEGTSYAFNLGGTYMLRTDYSILFAVGKGILQTSDSNRTSAYLGLKVIY